MCIRDRLLHLHYDECRALRERSALSNLHHVANLCLDAGGVVCMDLGASFLVPLVLSDVVHEISCNYDRSHHTVAHDFTGDHLAAHRQSAVKRTVNVRARFLGCLNVQSNVLCHYVILFFSCRLILFSGARTITDPSISTVSLLGRHTRNMLCILGIRRTPDGVPITSRFFVSSMTRPEIPLCEGLAAPDTRMSSPISS
eukprot:TRINITY_DN4183_c0_g4_i1.p1 TRINITY_DN4183_c0_g4~~TRINITY_DN4183_c0_g4_i1.p1  ORF type:complete len:199 (+),score=-38.58 TRINITY_DN4183_c0_g4_i1:182-778(+)